MNHCLQQKSLTKKQEEEFNSPSRGKVQKLIKMQQSDIPNSQLWNTLLLTQDQHVHQLIVQPKDCLSNQGPCLEEPAMRKDKSYDAGILIETNRIKINSITLEVRSIK